MSGVDIAGLVEELRERWEATDAPVAKKINRLLRLAKQAADALLAQAAELAEANRWGEILEAEQNAIAAKLPGVRFMDPPDGGSPSLAEQVKRMREALDAAERERDEALAALKASEEALDERIDTAWADGARFVVNELDSLIPDSTLVRDKLVDIDQMIARRYADAIASRKERRARSVLENSPATPADATNNPPSDPGTEQREAGRG